MLDTVILSFFNHCRKARSSTLYHFLIGKRTQSVLVYGYFYEILRFFGILPKLKQETYQKIIEAHIKNGNLESFENEVRLTEKGSRQLQNFSLQNYPFINQEAYAKIDEQSFRLFLLAVQVMSHVSYHSNQYIPVENTPFYTLQVKKWFQTVKLTHFKEELCILLERLPQAQADMLARQFSGYQVYGKTLQQLSEKDVLFQFFEQKNLIHQVLRLAHEFQSFNQLLMLYKKETSAKKTWVMIDNGKSLAEIASLRRVKPSTIQDHFIERALFDENFEFKNFYPQKRNAHDFTQEEIIRLKVSDLEELQGDFLAFRLLQIDWLREKRNGDS